MAPPAKRGEGAGGARPSPGDERGRGVTGGDLAGTSGERRWLLTGWAVAAAVVAGVGFINVLSITHEAPRYGVIRPVIWEASSALSHALWIWLPWLALRWSLSHPRPAWRAVLVHAPVLLAYSALHVSGFLVLRHLGYAVLHDRYDGGPLAPRFAYELGKDALAYGMMVMTFWLVRPRRAEPAPGKGPEMFDIRDGARLARVPLADILAVTSAGNYAEFVLADGRRLLMRSSLAALETALGPKGFVRTHRSWLVNLACVSGLRPEGSGDYAVELGGVEAPLSRRFPEALKRLRQG